MAFKALASSCYAAGFSYVYVNLPKRFDFALYEEKALQRINLQKINNK